MKLLKSIKVKKKLNLIELLEYVWENGEGVDKIYHVENSCKGVYITPKGSLDFQSSSILSKTDKFLVEVEEEINDKTRFDQALVITSFGDVKSFEDTDLSSIKKFFLLFLEDEIDKVIALVNGELELVWDEDLCG